MRPPGETTLHGPILNNPLAASKDLFKARLQNREHLGPLVRPASGVIVVAAPLSRDGHGSETNAHTICTDQHRIWRWPFAWTLPALAQDKGTLNPKPLPPLADPANPRLPAKEVFGRALTPLEAQARSIGFYSRGCLAGAKALPVDGESWQVVRLSRNRMWGNPAMIAFLERFSRKAKAEGVWNGILVGDISQPRGGPMLTGHASHQIGLDADVWLTPMPDRTLSREERETMSAVDMVSEDGLSVDRRTGRRRRPESSRPRRESRKSNASSSMRRSRRPCARPPRASPG